MRLHLRTGGLGAAAALMLVLPAAGPADASAARVTVPVDRADPAAGELSLYVRRLPARGPRRATVLYLAGGPGSAATAEVGFVADALGDGLRRTREVVAFDARGTGRSRAFACPELQRDRTLRSGAAAAACARRLGARRSTTSVAEQVEDVEAVRRALRVERLDLLGISYGTEVAQRYAQRHPGRVGRIVLDSVVPAEGPSPVGLDLFAGMPRVLRTLCARRRCADGVPGAEAGLATLVRRLRTAPLPGTVVDGRGRAQPRDLTPLGVLDVLLAGDFNPALRLALPAAIASAGRGDAAPLLRLGELDRAATPDVAPELFSAGQYAATSCESLDFPWDPAAAPDDRRAQAAARLAELGDGSFAPFDAATALDADFLALCAAWPAPARLPAPPPATLPPVPILLVAGEEDLRTPVESARAVAARDPRARLLTVPGVGHSVMTSDDSGCAVRAVRAFLLRTRAPRRCAGPEPYVEPVPLAPAAVDALGPGASAAQRVRRTLRAVDRTLDDVVVAVAVGGRRGGGLRGGTFVARRRGVALRGYEYVPGVRIDAVPRRDGSARLRVRGTAAAGGTIVLRRDGRVRGTLGGRAVRAAFDAGPPAS